MDQHSGTGIIHILLYFSVYIFAIWKFKYNDHDFEVKSELVVKA